MHNCWKRSERTTKISSQTLAERTHSQADYSMRFWYVRMAAERSVVAGEELQWNAPKASVCVHTVAVRARCITVCGYMYRQIPAAKSHADHAVHGSPMRRCLGWDCSGPSHSNIRLYLLCAVTAPDMPVTQRNLVFKTHKRFVATNEAVSRFCLNRRIQATMYTDCVYTVYTVCHIQITASTHRQSTGYAAGGHVASGYALGGYVAKHTS